MTNILSDAEENLVLFELTDSLTVEKIEELREAIDVFFNTNDRAPALVVQARSAPHWDSVKALITHLKLVHDRHKLVRKVAVIGDAYALQILPSLLDHFVEAKIRQFPEDRAKEARSWASAQEDHPGAFEYLDGFPRDVLALKAKGIITSKDYAELGPRLDAALDEHDKIKVYLELGEDFDRYTASAMWDDARLGLGRAFKISKIAVVSDLRWIVQSVKIFGPLMPIDVLAFSNDEAETAKSWIRS